MPLEDNGTQRGAGDIRTGFRWGWIANQCEHLTAQVKTRLPTGEARRAIGTGNTTIDVSLLYDRTIGQRAQLFAELSDWQTLDAVTIDTGDPSLNNQSANILRFGIGMGFDVLRHRKRCRSHTLTLLTECVTWTVLDGVTVDLAGNQPNLYEDATGDTIVNGKYGARYSLDKHSIYAGYGHNWTSDRWYADLFRFEYQRVF